MSKNIILGLLASLVVLFTGCLNIPEQNTKEDDRIGTKPIETTVPDGFDWKTTQDIALGVTIDDQYSGRYKYKIEIFTENPLLNSQAKSIKGISTNAFEKLSMTLPKSVKTLYICQTDPLSRRTVQAAEIVGNEVNISFAPIVSKKETKQASTKVAVRAASIAPTPGNAIEISGEKIILTTGNTYVIPQGSIFSGDITFPGEGNVSLYVEGEWSIEKAKKAYVWQAGTNVIVQSTGKISCSDNVAIDLIRNASLQIATGARIDAKLLSINLKDTQGSITNLGTVDVANITFSTLGTFINEGDLTVNNKFTSSNNTTFTNNAPARFGEIDFVGGIITNNDLIEVGKFTMNSNNAQFDNYATLSIKENSVIQNTTFNNYCLVTCADNKLLTLKGTIFNAKANSLFTCYDMEFNNGSTTINLETQAILDVRNKLTMSSNQNKIAGAGKDNSLARLYKVELKGWESVFYSNAQIETSSHTPNSQYDIKYVLEASANMVAWGESTITIQKNECSNTGNTPGGGSGTEGDQDDDLVYNTAYTYIMEDNWPVMGDYDLNDAVVELSSYTESTKNKSIKFVFNLLAVGATKDIGAGFQLNGITPSQIEKVNVIGGSNDSRFPLSSNGVEDGQKNAVIQLFENAHVLLIGTASHRPANTYIEDNISPKQIVVEVIFKDVADINAFKVSTLNFFITTSDNAKAGKRKEIHLRDYAPTDKGDVSFFGIGDDKSAETPYKSIDNFVWGIMIPSKFAYPLEAHKITLAYPKFENWISSGGLQDTDWYMHPDERYIKK